jgi:hypothetical protein
LKVLFYKENQKQMGENPHTGCPCVVCTEIVTTQAKYWQENITFVNVLLFVFFHISCLYLSGSGFNKLPENSVSETHQTCQFSQKRFSSQIDQ